MIDVPPAVSAAVPDRRQQRILQGAAFSRRIDAGIGNRAGGTQRVIARRTGRLADALTAVARFASRGQPIADTAEKVTQALIEEGMARAEKAACPAGDPRRGSPAHARRAHPGPLSRRADVADLRALDASARVAP